jgi:hypothetical protein
VLVLCTAVAGGLVGGWALNRAVLGDDGDSDVDSVVLAEPGEYQEPSDGDNREVDGERLPDVGLTTAEGLTITYVVARRDSRSSSTSGTRRASVQARAGEFAAVHRELGDQVRFVGVNPLDSVDVMQRFASDRGVGYELLRDDAGAFVNALGVRQLPGHVVRGSRRRDRRPDRRDRR